MTTVVAERRTIRVCAECGSMFTVHRRRGRPKLTCSPRCRALRLAALAEKRAADCCSCCGSSRKHWRPTYTDESAHLGHYPDHHY
jgi:hypothetical protein